MLGVEGQQLLDQRQSFFGVFLAELQAAHHEIEDSLELVLLPLAQVLPVL